MAAEPAGPGSRAQPGDPPPPGGADSGHGGLPPSRMLRGRRHAGSSAGGEFRLKHSGGSGAAAGFLLGARPRSWSREGKGQEELESQHREIPSRIPSWEWDRAGSQGQAQARPSAGIMLLFCHIALNAAWWERGSRSVLKPSEPPTTETTRCWHEPGETPVVPLINHPEAGAKCLPTP